MLVFVLPQKMLSPLGLLEQNIMLLYHKAEQKRIMDNRLAIFIFFLFSSVSPSTVCCIHCTSFMCMLHLFVAVFGGFQMLPIGGNMNCSVVNRFESLSRKYASCIYACLSFKAAGESNKPHPRQLLSIHDGPFTSAKQLLKINQGFTIY